MAGTDTHLLNNIPDQKPVRVFLPLKGTQDRYRSQGIYHRSTPSVFNLYFQPGGFPADSLDLSGISIVNIDLGGPSLSLEAKISEIKSSQHLVMTVVKSISHEQMREFFRVDAVTNVIGRSIHPQLVGSDKENDWTLRGETIDISGSGILASFSQKPPAEKQIRLEITLPMEEPEVIKALAHPVRTVKVSDNQFDVAFHFIDITTEDRDKIIGCCLEIQRRLLRLKVKVKDL